jgi:hypothetical protein
MVQRYPTGKNNAEDTCQRVTYGYDTNAVDATFSQYSQKRLATVQYNTCAPGNTTAVTEMYSYRPAGAVAAKQMQVSRYEYDPGGDFGGTAVGSVEADYTYDTAGKLASYQTIFPTGQSGVSPQPVTYMYGFDGMGRAVSLTDDLGVWLYETANTNWAQNAQYDVAGRQTSLQFWVGLTASNAAVFTTETRGYNQNGQMTDQNWTSASATTFTHAAGACTMAIR